MKNLLHVDKRDKERVLLTELLPYEVPLWFDNYSVRRILKSNDNAVINASRFLWSAGGRPLYEPLNFDVKKNDDDLRRLSVIHPCVQREFVDFYNDYADLIVYYCQRSQYSLRAPSGVASAFAAPSALHSMFGVEREEVDQLHSSSYFKYRKYSFLYEFFESHEFHSLERRFSKFTQLDVAKCFPHIYTHSIGWAVKSRTFAKNNIGQYSFDDQFDKLMQRANYLETNGILVGPEVSRIFAEIILQQVDLDFVQMASQKGLKIGSDFEFRRYVDDYFLFYKKEADYAQLKTLLSSCLVEYKLFLNDAKTRYSMRPFMSSIAVCKNNLSSALDEMHNSLLAPTSVDESSSIASSLRNVANVSRHANKWIVEIKAIMKSSGVAYSSVSTYLIPAILRKFKSLLLKAAPEGGPIEAGRSERIANATLIILDVAFFCYAMDVRVSSTNKIASLIFLSGSLADRLQLDDAYLVRKKIFDSSRVVLEANASEVIKANRSCVELVNLLLSTANIGDEFMLTQDAIQKSLPVDCISSSDGYFYWVSMMLYVRDKPAYGEIRNRLIKHAVDKFEKLDYSFRNCECYLFISDFISCPWVSLNDRKKVFANFAKKNDMQIPHLPADVDLVMTTIDAQKIVFFVDWYNRDLIKQSLRKKVFHHPYE